MDSLIQNIQSFKAHFRVEYVEMESFGTPKSLASHTIGMFPDSSGLGDRCRISMKDQDDSTFESDVLLALDHIKNVGITTADCRLQFVLERSDLKDMDLLKFMMFLDEPRLLKDFPSDYSICHLRTLMAALTENSYYAHNDFKTFLVAYSKELSIDTKHATYNFPLWKHTGELEFNFIVGPHIEHKSQLVIEDIKDCVFAMEKALDPTYDEEYLKKAQEFWREHVTLGKNPVLSRGFWVPGTR